MVSSGKRIKYHVRVKQVRDHFALSQTAIAQRVGMSLRAYQNYERGEREVPVALIHALYSEFKVDPVWLLTGTGPMIFTDKDIFEANDFPIQ